MSSIVRILGLASVLIILTSSQLLGQGRPGYRVERDSIPGGAELLTIVQHQEGAVDVPLISVLRDTLGDQDPENDRLRYVWILTTARPSLTQRIASALPVACFRFSRKRPGSTLPKPVLDLASPGRGVWTRLFSDSFQVLQLDSMGALVRATTRCYRGNAQEYRAIQIARARRALEELMRDPGNQGALSIAELRLIFSRLQLSNRILGGLVREESVESFYDHQLFRNEQTRDHNWELLRQRAELCGLYFDPIESSRGEASEALLWVARRDLEERQSRTYQRQFLNIANPWTDDRLLHWTGYSAVWYFDAGDHVVAPETAGARPQEMIPLALYSLDYPRVPLLLVDFRDALKPKRRELAAHGATTVLTGLLGITRFSNWSFLAASTVWNFVRSRHGAALDHDARIEAYSETDEHIHANGWLDPELKSELLSRLAHLALNPLDNAIEAEESLAREQNRDLVAYAESSTGLSAKLNRDRQKELADDRRSAASRLFVALGQVFTGGPRLRTANDEMLRAQVDLHRRAAYHIHFLNGVLAAGGRPEGIGNVEDIRKAIQALEGETDAGPEATRIITRILKGTEDLRLRLACVEALRNSSSEQARAELRRLAEDPHTIEAVRVLCNNSLTGETGQAVAGAQ